MTSQPRTRNGPVLATRCTQPTCSTGAARMPHSSATSRGWMPKRSSEPRNATWSTSSTDHAAATQPIRITTCVVAVCLSACMTRRHYCTSASIKLRALTGCRATLRPLTIHVGTAPDSWGVWHASDPRQTPWQRFLDEVAEAGYDAIELGPFGYLPTEPQRVADELGKRSLQLAGGTLSGNLSSVDGWPDMRRTAESVCDVLEHLGARFLVLLDNGPRELDERGWVHLRDTAHRLGEYTASRSIATVFHPHGDTAIQFEPEIERFLELTDPGLVNLCLDVGHHAYAGGDAVSFFQKHHARVPYLHLKDVDAAISA